MLKWIILALLPAVTVSSQTGPISGFCEQGAAQTQVLGSKSINYSQGVIPSCRVAIYLHGLSAVQSATYQSGGSISGTSGQSCVATFNGGQTNGTGIFTLTANNTIAVGTSASIPSPTGTYTTAPTTATLSNGTAVCSGTANVTASITPAAATIYADLNNTPKSNPFTASNTGQFIAYATGGILYDVTRSGGIPPNSYTSPLTTTVLVPPPAGGACSGCAILTTTSSQVFNGPLTIPTATIGTLIPGSAVTSNYLWTFNQGIQLSNNAPIVAESANGSACNLAYVDVSNNYYFGDVNNCYSGSGFWMNDGAPSLTFTSGAVTFNKPPVFGSFILNGSQSMTAVQGSTATKVMSATGTFTPGDCVKVAADGSAQDSGAGCGGGGGVVSSLTTSGSSGAATLAAGVLNIPVYTVSGVADVDVTISSITIAANSSFPQYPASANTFSMPGVTTAMVVLCGFSGDPVITTGWGQVGGLKISPWVSSNGTVSYRIYNQTGASITSGSTALRCMAQ